MWKKNHSKWILFKKASDHSLYNDCREGPSARSYTTCLPVSFLTFICVCAFLHKLCPVLSDAEAFFFLHNPIGAITLDQNLIRRQCNLLVAMVPADTGVLRQRSVICVPLKQMASSAKLPTILYQYSNEMQNAPLGWSQSVWDWLNLVKLRGK